MNHGAGRTPIPRRATEVNCPGCNRLIRGRTDDLRRAAVLRHVRNCNALMNSQTVSADQVANPEPTP